MQLIVFELIDQKIQADLPRLLALSAEVYMPCMPTEYVALCQVLPSLFLS